MRREEQICVRTGDVRGGITQLYVERGREKIDPSVDRGSPCNELPVIFCPQCQAAVEAEVPAGRETRTRRDCCTNHKANIILVCLTLCCKANCAQHHKSGNKEKQFSVI